MSAECIHGFEAGMCATCFPAAEPVVDKPVRRTPPRGAPTAPRASSGVRHGTTRSARGSARSVDPKPINIAEQRIYHITHIDNLAAILDDSALIADAILADRPAVDIASHDARAVRRGIDVTVSGATVAEHVPFYLSPDAYLWDAIRSGTADPRLSQAAYRGSAYDYVVLVTTIGGIQEHLGIDAVVVVADGDAAGPLTRFDADPRSRTLRTMLLAEEEGDLLRAELLVPDRVPFSVITLVGVANLAQRAAVKDLLDLAGAKPRVSVYPPWFQTAE